MVDEKEVAAAIAWLGNMAKVYQALLDLGGFLKQELRSGDHGEVMVATAPLLFDVAFRAKFGKTLNAIRASVQLKPYQSLLTPKSDWPVREIRDRARRVKMYSKMAEFSTLPKLYQQKWKALDTLVEAAYPQSLKVLEYFQSRKLAGLRGQLIRLAHQKPELRPVLLPLLKD